MVYNIDHWDEGVKQNGWWHAVETGMFGVGAAFGMNVGLKGISPTVNRISTSANRSIDNWAGKNYARRRLANNIRLPKETVINFIYAREIQKLLPKGYTRVLWKPGRITHGSSFNWTNSSGHTITVRIHSHDPSPNIPATSNAAQGWIGRVEVQIHGKGTQFMDGSGVLHHGATTVKNNVSIANDTHVPIKRFSEAIRKLIESAEIPWN